ncbi:MAG: 2-polyprenyl-3-methyl-6-methoxy-1,4-benzoquinone monooxygenase [Burkholderiaceae bacterium]
MESLRRFSLVDRVLGGACRALATLSDAVPARRPVPGASTGSQAADEIELTEPERRLSGALMRVNHVGEICAQALYEGQAASTSDPALREYFLGAAREEADHLAWTRSRLDELGASPSLLNPVWFAGSLAMGLVAGRVGDRWSLGFMAETERQVEAHLGSHLNRLPAADHRSRHIIEAMQRDETAHARRAHEMGGAELPAVVQQGMRAAARVMTTVAHRI